MAPIKSTWAWRQTRFEKSGANGAKNRIIMVGRVRTSITSFWQIVVTSVPYPSCLQMAKVEYRIRLYTSEYERETRFGGIGVHALRRPLPQGHRSGAAHPLGYGLADVAGRFDPASGWDGGLLQEVGEGDRPALRARRGTGTRRSSPRQPWG